MTIRVLPQSKSRSLVEYILYERLPNRCPLSQDEISELKQNTVLEIQQLEKRQKLLLMTNYSSGESDLMIWQSLPSKTDKPAVKQDKIKQALQAHLNVEKNLGIELYPAAQNQSFTQVGREDDQCELEDRQASYVC